MGFYGSPILEVLWLGFYGMSNVKGLFVGLLCKSYVTTITTKASSWCIGKCTYISI